MLTASLTVLALAGAGLFAHGEKAGDAVATVDGHAIERQEFEHWMVVAANSSGVSQSPPDRANGYRRCIAAKRKAVPVKDRGKLTDRGLARQCEQEYTQLRNQVMQLLISFKWIEGEAALQNVTVTDAEVTESFEEQKRQSFPRESEYRKFLRRSGQSEADILRRVRLDLLSNKLRDKVVAGADRVTDEQIAQYYAENKALFAEPEKRALRVLLTRRETQAEQAREALERGTSWKAVAKRYSIDSPSNHDGGRTPAVAEENLDRRLGNAVFRAAEHRLVGPVRTRDGYWVFTVTRVVPARQRPLDEVSKTIEATLDSQAEQEKLTAFVREFSARWRAKTECAAGYTTSDCRNGPTEPSID